MKVILLVSAIMLAVYFVDNIAASPYPSIGKGKSKRLGKCAFYLMISSEFLSMISFEKLLSSVGLKLIRTFFVVKCIAI